MQRRTIVRTLLASVWLAGCQAPPAGASSGGTLLVVGGGLDNDNRPVFERFLQLASAPGPARVVIATAATGDQEAEVVDKQEALRTWAPGLDITVIRRETPTAETVALVDGATALLFTGGDQQRITDRYRPGDVATPEWSAMQRLLRRGGVIAGCSAGLAMMGEVMFLTGRSAAALGVEPKPTGDGSGRTEPPQLGPQLGPGMSLLPWALPDSHFFERDRLGRLVAGLEASGRRLGLGVGEDAAVEVDLATGVLTSVSVSDSLLVDASQLRREGLSRRGLRARVLRQGDRVSLRQRLATGLGAPPAMPAGPARRVPVAEPGQNRQLASWRLFVMASVPGSGSHRLDLEGWSVVAWPDGAGEVVCDVLVGR